MKFLFSLLVFFSLLFSVQARELRTFTNQDGRSIEAELIRFEEGMVRIRANGRVFDIAADTLSEADQAWLAEQATDESEGPEDTYYDKLIFEDDFSSDDFDEMWGHYVSESVIVDGVLVGRTIDINDHAGVDNIRFEGKQDLKVAVKFNFAGEAAERFNVWMDDKDYKGSHAGHICNVTISPTHLAIDDAKTGKFENEIYTKRKAGEPLGEEVDEMLAEKGVRFDLDLDREEWHTLVIRTKGNICEVEINGDVIGELESEGVGHETKSLVSLTTYVNDVHYDNFSVRYGEE